MGSTQDSVNTSLLFFLLPFSLDLCCPVELFAMMEIFYTFAVQYGSHKLDAAIEQVSMASGIEELNF